VNIAERIEEALRAESRIAALTALVHAFRAEGMTKQAIGESYHEVFQRLLKANREAEADTIADVLDGLTGWCSPSNRPIPAEPDVKRSACRRIIPCAR